MSHPTEISSITLDAFKLFEKLSGEHEKFVQQYGRKNGIKMDENNLQKVLEPQLKLINEIGSLATKATGYLVMNHN